MQELPLLSQEINADYLDELLQNPDIDTVYTTECEEATCPIIGVEYKSDAISGVDTLIVAFVSVLATVWRIFN